MKKKSNLIIKMDEIEKDLLKRKAQLLYPDCEQWVLDLALEAYYNSLKAPIIVEEPTIEIN